MALGKVGLGVPSSQVTFQPTWSRCRCVCTTMSTSSGAMPSAASRSSRLPVRFPRVG